MCNQLEREILTVTFLPLSNELTSEREKTHTLTLRDEVLNAWRARNAPSIDRKPRGGHIHVYKRCIWGVWFLSSAERLPRVGRDNATPVATAGAVGVKHAVSSRDFLEA